MLLGNLIIEQKHKKLVLFATRRGIIQERTAPANLVIEQEPEKLVFFAKSRGIIQERTATSNWPASYGSWQCVPLQILNNNDYFSFFNQQMYVRCVRVSEWWWLLLMYIFCIYFKWRYLICLYIPFLWETYSFRPFT